MGNVQKANEPHMIIINGPIKYPSCLTNNIPGSQQDVLEPATQILWKRICTKYERE